MATPISPYDLVAFVRDKRNTARTLLICQISGDIRMEDIVEPGTEWIHPKGQERIARAIARRVAQHIGLGEGRVAELDLDGLLSIISHIPAEGTALWGDEIYRALGLSKLIEEGKP